jgi:hypothetical protein
MLNIFHLYEPGTELSNLTESVVAKWGDICLSVLDEYKLLYVLSHALRIVGSRVGKHVSFAKVIS